MKSAVAPTVLVLALLAVLLAGGPTLAFHGFGGGRGGGGGGGSHEEFHEVGGRGSSAEFHEADCGDYGRGHREDEGREESFGRTPSFSAGGSHEGSGSGISYGSRRPAARMREGEIKEDERSGSDHAERGGTIDYGAEGAGARVAVVHAARRGVSGIVGTTSRGRSHATAGRADGEVAPGGKAVAGRSNVGVATGSRGTAVEGSRGFAPSGSGETSAGRASGASWLRPHGFNAYESYHKKWVHGYWGGHDSAAWGWRDSYWGRGQDYRGWGAGLGLGLGYGLPCWGYGSWLYDLGYTAYDDPYYDDYHCEAEDAGVVITSPYDYSQPIDTTSDVDDESETDQAEVTFDLGRASFKHGNYSDALKQADSALAELPGDTTLHEFRALCLFALKRYDEAAAAVHAVLAVDPGWDWTTLISLYPDINTYTVQLRTLEEYCQSRTGLASARFVLAYHYLTLGYTDSAVTILKQVVALKPGDALSAKLLRQLDASQAADAPAAPAPAATTPPQGAVITGTWTAQPAADTAVALAIQRDGEFTWKVTRKGQTQQLAGKSSFGGGLLALAQDEGAALVGRVDWKDANHMNFRIVGDGRVDPGLAFSKGPVESD